MYKLGHNNHQRCTATATVCSTDACDWKDVHCVQCARKQQISKQIGKKRGKNASRLRDVEVTRSDLFRKNRFQREYNQMGTDSCHCESCTYMYMYNCILHTLYMHNATSSQTTVLQYINYYITQA